MAGEWTANMAPLSPYSRWETLAGDLELLDQLDFSTVCSGKPETSFLIRSSRVLQSNATNVDPTSMAQPLRAHHGCLQASFQLESDAGIKTVVDDHTIVVCSFRGRQDGSSQ